MCSQKVVGKEVPGLHTRTNQGVSNESNITGPLQFAKGKHKGEGRSSQGNIQ